MLKPIITILLITNFSLFAQLMEDSIKVNDMEVQKAVELYEKQDYKTAQSTLELIIDKNDKNAEAYYVLSKVLFRMDELGDAIDAAEASVELNDKNVDYHFNLALLYSVDVQDASIFRITSVASSLEEELLATLKLKPVHVDAIVYLAEFYTQMPGILGGDIDKAIEQANILIKLDEKRGRLAFAKIYDKQENKQEAEDEYKILETKFGNDPENFDLYNSYGYFLLDQGRINEAIQKFKIQVELAPNDANAHDSLGDGYLKKGMLKESLEEYTKTLELNPKSENAKKMIEEIKERISNE